MFKTKPFDAAQIVADVAEFKRTKVQSIRAEIARLEAVIAQLDGEPAKTMTQNGTEAPRVKRKGKRVRRSPEELSKVAAAVHKFVASGGKAGVSGADIRKTVPGAKLVQQMKAFVEQYGGGKLKTTGAKAAMRYFAV